MRHDPHSDVGYLSNRLARLLRGQLARELAPLDLTGPQAAVLLALAGAEEAPTVSETADRLGMDRPTMTGVVERLVRDGWLESLPNPADGRSRLLALTARAQGAVPALARASSTASADALAGLSPAEQEQLVELLGRATTSLETACRLLDQADTTPEANR
jgi:DNA-binding MarR family transcriptional regulator